MTVPDKRDHFRQNQKVTYFSVNKNTSYYLSYKRTITVRVPEPSPLKRSERGSLTQRSSEKNDEELMFTFFKIIPCSSEYVITVSADSCSHKKWA